MSFPPAIPAAPVDDREEDYLSARTGHWTVFTGLLPFVWPKDRRDLRIRVVLAFAVLVLAKLVTVAVPIFYKDATDQLSALSGEARLDPATGLALGVGMLIVAYGTGRVLTMVLTQIRDVIFTEVGQNAVRQLNNRTFAHLHRLSLRFHLERRTGGLSRVIERATRGIELIIRMGILNIVPTALELAARHRHPALLLRLALRADHRRDRRGLHVVHVRGERAAHRHPPRDERQRHRRQHQGDRQPVELRDRQVLRQRGGGGAPLRHLDGALREGRDQDLPFAGHAELGPGADLHRRHDGVHAAGRARRHCRHAHHRRVRDDQRADDPALHAAELHGHGLPRDQAGARRPGSHVRAAARRARRSATSRAPRRSPSRRARSASRTSASPTSATARS